jgi:hypothetical protein
VAKSPRTARSAGEKGNEIGTRKEEGTRESPSSVFSSLFSLPFSPLSRCSTRTEVKTVSGWFGRGRGKKRAQVQSEEVGNKFLSFFQRKRKKLAEVFVFFFHSFFFIRFFVVAAAAAAAAAGSEGENKETVVVVMMMAVIKSGVAEPKKKPRVRKQISPSGPRPRGRRRGSRPR